MMKRLLSPFVYLKSRLSERTTWAGIVLAITGAAALSTPYSWLAIGAGTIAAMLPEKAGTNAE